MAYEATVIEIMLASPGDVPDERKIVRDVIAEWNAVYARDRSIVLLPVGWETHSSPELAGRPQQMINERLLAKADVLVGIFWTRVGSPTGKAISGSIEEVEEHLRQDKPVMLYFSRVPVAIDSVDRTQYEKLTEFKAWAQQHGLVEYFDNREDFREKFQRQLPITLRDNPYLQRLLLQSSVVGSAEVPGPIPSGSGVGSISDDARELLIAAAGDRNGMVMVHHHLGGTSIGARGKQFNQEDDRRSTARWEAAVQELHDRNLLRDRSGRGEIFEITEAGYRLVEGLA